jgi:hypothetical protein
MPRKKLNGDWWGESQRFTVRLSRSEQRALRELATAWQTDTSAAIRRAVREAAADVRRQELEKHLTELPALNRAELRSLASRLRVAGRSRMSKAELLAAIRQRLRARLQAAC